MKFNKVVVVFVVIYWCSFCWYCYYFKFSPSWVSNSLDIFVVVVVIVLLLLMLLMTMTMTMKGLLFFVVLSQKPSIKSLVKIGSEIDEMLLLLLPSSASTSTKSLAEVSLILGIIFPPLTEKVF